MRKVKVFLVVFFLFVIIMISFFGAEINNFIPEKTAKSAGVKSSVPAVMPVVTLENLPNFFEKQKMVQELPRDALILVHFYDFDATGNRFFEESYLVKKGSVTEAEGDPEADLVVYMAARYIPELGWFCSAIKKARKNGDFSYEMKMGKVGLLWKYRGMMKYKDCVVG